MRPSRLVLALALLAACSNYHEPPAFARTGELVHGASLDKALLVQRSLFPYHFALDGSQLNALGQRDLAVLAAHFTRHPGNLSVRRGAASDALYDARLAAVLDALAEAGVERDAMRLSDALPGGDGMAGSRVVTILTAPTDLSSEDSGGSAGAALGLEGLLGG